MMTIQAVQANNMLRLTTALRTMTTGLSRQDLAASMTTLDSGDDDDASLTGTSRAELPDDCDDRQD